MTDPTVPVPLGPVTDERDGDNRPVLPGIEPESLGDGFRMTNSWLRYAAFGVLLLVILFPVFAFIMDVKTALATTAAVILMIGATIVTLGGDRHWKIPRRFQEHRWNVFGTHIDLGSVGFGLLLIPFAMGVMNILFTLLGAEPLFGIITTVVFMAAISLRYIEQQNMVLRVGLAICLIAFAATRLVGNEALRSDWIRNVVESALKALPDLLWISLVCVATILVVGIIRFLVRINWPARVLLAVVILTLGAEIATYSVSFSLNGVAGDLKCVQTAQDDRFVSNNGVTGELGDTGLCDKDGPDFWIALIRLAGMSAVGWFMFREHRRRELTKQNAGDVDDIAQNGGFRVLHGALLGLDGTPPPGMTGGVLKPRDPDDDSDPELEEWAIHALVAGLLVPQLPLRELTIGQELADLARAYPAFRKRQMIQRIVWEDHQEPMTNPRTGRLNARRLREVFGPRGSELFHEARITKQELETAHAKLMDRLRKARAHQARRWEPPRQSPPPPPPPPSTPPPPPPTRPSPTDPPDGGAPPPPPANGGTIPPTVPPPPPDPESEPEPEAQTAVMH